jgi:hypothetical protein
MRKLLSVSLLAALTAVTTGCECWDCFMQLENWKNQTLFGCCSPSAGACAPYGAGYQYATPQYAAPQYAAPYADCAGVAADCAGVVVQSPYAGSACPGGMCAPPPQGVIVPGQPVIGSGQVIMPSQVLPGTTVTPMPETYAPSN